MTMPLYPSEAQIAREVMGDRHKDWPSKARFYEAKDPTFPKINQLMGGRYWPAVKLWFDRQNGVATIPDAPTITPPEPRVRIGIFEPDGKENFDAADASQIDRRRSGNRSDRQRLPAHRTP
ncbi:hypothetical protein [Afipia carboxidovorans]|uniref:hypothetical protein n=1 Tax=Afipia carboxidovorans TaxID=40137 RepID=UPI00308C7CEE|nr:hypothetical protein CRBSH125_05540 [Afipia carboxidovorans]